MTLVAIIGALVWVSAAAALLRIAHIYGQRGWKVHVSVIGWPLVVGAVVLWVLLCMVAELVHELSSRLLVRLGL